jgi:crotonobetainyl-CoA:carnitine CoA-transferase CaiB-like acyl-CoA transferase
MADPEASTRPGLLAGKRIVECGQYVAAPFAAMLLADLGADVIKVEPPGGDQWRHYDPIVPGNSAYFLALNRNKRSVVLDLKTEEGREECAALLRDADALVHNHLAERARRFGLDRDRVRELNPRCVWVCVSSFGSDGPDAGRPGYDLIGQALAGLLLAHPRVGDTVPVRLGGLALADFTAGLLAGMATLAGLLAANDTAPGIEVSLLGAALALQAQRFVSLGDGDAATKPFADDDDLREVATAMAEAEALDPYYRAHRCADGFVALACLHPAQRRAVCEALGLRDPWLENPQRRPADQAERRARVAHAQRVAEALATRTVAATVGELGALGVPVSHVRRLDQLFTDPQVRANGLVQTVEQDGLGTVRLLGNLFKVDGEAPPGAPAPALGEHGGEVLSTEVP